MLPLRIDFTELARRDLDERFRYISKDSPDRAAEYLERVLLAINSLARFPRRFPIAPESRRWECEVRCLSLYPLRILYSVGPTVVTVIRVRHGAQKLLRSSETPD